MSIVNYRDVLAFWYNPENQPYWFEKNENFDAELRDKFYDTWVKACEGLLYEWRETTEGRLAEIIVLDQFSRNLCRGESCAFEQDGMALVLAQEIRRQPDFEDLPQDYRKFALMPFMHSESKGIHEIAVPIFEDLGDEGTTKYEYLHKDIIDRFGRYPHRNEDLGRESTEEELEFLKQPGSSF